MQGDFKQMAILGHGQESQLTAERTDTQVTWPLLSGELEFAHEHV